MKCAIIGIVLGLVGIAQAQSVKYCAGSSNVCYSVNVPAATALSGNGDLYFQIQGPASKQWIGLGQGGRMIGANIFIIYSSKDGQNVTLSPRLAKSYSEPLFTTDTKFSLLDGSGIANGLMTANVRCFNCASWSGGSMSFTDSASSWIYAYRDGSPLASDDPRQSLIGHNANAPFTLDLTKAAGGSTVNPFAQNIPPDASGSSDGASGGETSQDRMIVAHGVLLALAFLILFPFGAIIIRVLSFNGLVWFHAGWQLVAYAIAWAGFGLGIYIAKTSDAFNATHPIIGLTVLGALVFQPILGLIHHFIYRRERRRTLWAHAHIWYGRAILLLGVVNGGLGLQLAGNDGSSYKAYIVIAALVYAAYLGIIVWSTIVSRRKEEGETGDGVFGTKNPPLDHETDGRRKK